MIHIITTELKRPLYILSDCTNKFNHFLKGLVHNLKMSFNVNNYFERFIEKFNTEICSLLLVERLFSFSGMIQRSRTSKMNGIWYLKKSIFIKGKFIIQ